MIRVDCYVWVVSLPGRLSSLDRVAELQLAEVRTSIGSEESIGQEELSQNNSEIIDLT